MEEFGDTLDTLNRGIYSVADAASITGLSSRRLREWVLGRSTARGASRPVVHADYGVQGGDLYLSFLDVVELDIIRRLRAERVPLSRLRSFVQEARTMFEDPHPFCTRRFGTDGKRMYLDDGRAIMEMGSGQVAIREVLEVYIRFFELGDRYVERWWPLGRDRLVLLDPTRSFGAPIVKSGVPVLTLMRAHSVEGDCEAVADWFEIDIAEVKDAIEYGQRQGLAA